MKLIEFSELNFKLLILLIFPTFKTIENFTKKMYVVEEHFLFKAFRYFISYIFCAPFLFISIHKNKESTITPLKLNAENENNNIRNIALIREIPNEINQLKVKIDKKRKIKSFIFLLILCIIGMSSYIYRKLEVESYEYAKQSIGIFFDIGFYIFLSFLILKYINIIMLLL